VSEANDFTPKIEDIDEVLIYSEVPNKKKKYNNNIYLFLLTTILQ